MRFSFAALLMVAVAGSGAVAMKVPGAHPSTPRLTPAMEETIRAVIEAQLQKRPEMRFNTTRIREIQERANKADSNNDDTVSQNIVESPARHKLSYSLAALDDSQKGLSIGDA